ncbi:hypothetical protein [Azospirillum brasilense]|uniref:hypothetical protein n=1 Tax=Azospirillum brasilense TaxID=192 RepID=UPI000E6986A3|nr:hypothetical protein [Azospirillum brasilense]NUB25225.1 hypothetical protein [Azospirillum brasilense]NUB32893.1 hypothetical protein [Azospirillum brasilense]RIW02304.1 hypothetical protein D2T81_15945 [Azospirillum brasilense]
MNGPSDTVIERVKVREVAGVFRSPDALDAAADALLYGGFDRADIDLMAHSDTIREKLGDVYAPAEELADVPDVPRRAYIAHADVATTTALVAGALSYVGAAAAALGVVASGGTLALALAAAAAGGAAGGGAGALISRVLGAERARELETLMAVGGLVLWVRVRTPEQEEKAQRILREHGADAVRVHEIEIDKRLEDLPLASLRPDPWLSDEPLAKS